MTDVVKTRPMLTLMRCEALRPERVTPVSGRDFELDRGAIGVGTVDIPSGRSIVLSIHHPDGEVLMARFEEGARDLLLELLLHGGQLSQPGDLPN